MGIYIRLAISEAVTKEEWEKVYNETLQLVEVFPLAERRRINIKGIETICLTKTIEREHVYGWNNEIIEVGWETNGDSDYLKTAESYYIPKDLIEEREINENAEDAMLAALPACLGYDWGVERVSHVYNLWGGKSQGEPYHMYLLAIACLIENRLKHKAYVYGDITCGQCVAAIAIANKYLEKKITLPDRCVINRLYDRVSRLNFNAKDKLKIFISEYLGKKEEKFGEFIRTNYSKDVCYTYWKDMFEDSIIGTFGFDNAFNKYLLWGFDLSELCKLVQYHDEKGNELYKEFIVRIMDAKLHVEEKDCRDLLAVEESDPTPYTIWTLMAQFVFAGARNKKVNRYIPIEELRKILLEEFADKCDVNSIIDTYLEKEANSKEIKVNKETDDEEFQESCEIDVNGTFNQVMDMWKEQIMEKQEKYDVLEYENLLFFKKDDTMCPSLEEAVKEYFQFYQDLIKEETFTQLMNETAHTRCAWLVEQNKNILIRDSDWEKIFETIEKDKDSFERYYSMVRVKAYDEEVQNLVKAIVLNDELYEFLLKNTITER